MKYRKLVPMLCMMSLVVMSACSNSSDSGKTADVKSPDPSPTTAPVEVKETEPPGMEFDMGGRTIKVVSWFNMEPNEDNPDNIKRKENLEALMKKHNFKMEWITIDYGEYHDKVTASLVAGEPLGDIIRLGRNFTIPTLVKQDLLWPIDEYTSNSNAFNQSITKEQYTYKGRGYGFNNQLNLVQGIFYNRTLMNQLGMKPLQEYVDSNTWDWETFIKVAKEANKDTNNDGKLDTWGLASGGFLDFALASNEASLTNAEKLTLDDPKTLEAFNLISRVATEKVDRPTEGGDWQEPGQFFRQGNTLMYPGALYQTSGLKTDMPNMDIGFIPFPKGPSATKFNSFENAVQALTIPKKAKNPEQLMYIWEKYNDIESVYDYPGQAEYETLFSDENDIKNVRMVEPNLRIFEHGTYPSDKFPYYSIIGDLRNGVSVSTVVETYKAQAQAAIDEVWK